MLVYPLVLHKHSSHGSFGNSEAFQMMAITHYGSNWKSFVFNNSWRFEATWASETDHNQQWECEHCHTHYLPHDRNISKKLTGQLGDMNASLGYKKCSHFPPKWYFPPLKQSVDQGYQTLLLECYLHCNCV